MEFQKIVDLLDRTSDDKDLARFATKNGLKYMINQKKNYSINKEIRIKTPMLRSDLCGFIDAYIVVKGDIIFTEPEKAKRNKSVAFKKMRHLSTAFQKSMVYKLTMQKIWML